MPAGPETARLAQRFRQIAQEFPVMIYALDREYRVVIWNEQCERVTGYRYEEIANDPRALERLYPLEVLPHLAQCLSEKCPAMPCNKLKFNKIMGFSDSLLAKSLYLPLRP